MTDDEKLDFQELIDVFNSIWDEVPSVWAIPMTCEERLHYDEHPPSPEEIELLVRKRGAVEIKGHSIHSWRLPDRLRDSLMQVEEFKHFQTV